MLENINKFELSGNILLVNDETESLDAYRWNAPYNQPVFFVFSSSSCLHIITLDEAEAPFDRVISRNEEKVVRLITNEEVQLHAAKSKYSYCLETADGAEWLS